MANVNKVMLIGRLTRDPESRAFANGGKVVKFRLRGEQPPQEPANGAVGRRAGLH